jgi:hydrogenase expression/formation protein HypC
MCLAIPGQVLSIEGHDPLMRQGRVTFAGIVKQVNLAYTPEAAVGDYVLVHAGVAIAIVDEDEAVRTLQMLSETELEELQ